MKKLFTLLLMLMVTMGGSAQERENQATPKSKKVIQMEQAVLQLSHDKWQWMSEKDADKLAEIFHDEAVFVHMGGAWGKEQEVNIIRSGMIHYKEAKINNESIRIVGNTATILCDMDLLAILGGRQEAKNHFMVTEIFVKEGKEWKLTSLSFTKLGQ